MEKRSKFDRAVLALFALFVVCGGLFAACRGCPAGAWQVQTEREDSGQASSVTEVDGRPDSLLEGEVMDLNRASAKELERLPGIGPGRAADIVAYRQEQGDFQSVDQLEEVRGIGPATLEALRPYVTVGGTTGGGG